MYDLYCFTGKYYYVICSSDAKCFIYGRDHPKLTKYGVCFVEHCLDVFIQYTTVASCSSQSLRSLRK